MRGRIYLHLLLSLIWLTGSCQKPTSPANRDGPQPSTRTDSISAVLTYRLTEAGLQFEIPAAWQQTREETAGVKQHVITTSDDGLRLVFIGAENEQQAAQIFDAKLAEVRSATSNFKILGEDTSPVNGIEHEGRHGTAEKNGQLIHWSIDGLHGEKYVILTSMLAQETLDQYLPAYQKFLASLKKIR